MADNDKDLAVFDALSALYLEASHQSRDYVRDKKQFQLHFLVTEQRHPKTWTLSQTAQVSRRRGEKNSPKQLSNFVR